jgi:predicted dehydrogenase
MTRLKVALIGCGKIADQHVRAIQRCTGSEVVAVCDREPMMAEQLSERFGIPGRYMDADEMLRTERPDVVHIVTPPQTHETLALRCLEAGVHVYVEKPFTVTAAEAARVVGFARERGLQVTAGHNCQFTPEMLRMRQLVRDGYLGGAPLHMESHWPYDLGDTSYVGPLLADPQHWVRSLPGQLLHNILSHGIARLAEFMGDGIPDVLVLAGRSEAMRRHGDRGVTDELRVLLRDERGTTGLFCFSTSLKPAQNTFRLFGRRGSLIVDVSSGALARHPVQSDKSYLAFVMPNLRAAREYGRNAAANFAGVVRGRLYQDSGMGELVARFHDAVAERGPAPIPPEEIVRVAAIMDRIFAACRSSESFGR